MSPAVQEQRILNVGLSSCFFLGGPSGSSVFMVGNCLMSKLNGPLEILETRQLKPPDTTFLGSLILRNPPSTDVHSKN
jgi:hypothetical protein